MLLNRAQVAVVFFASIAACDGSTVAPIHEQSSVAALSIAASEGLAGFVLPREKTRMFIGDPVEVDERKDLGITRYIGTDGVFGTGPMGFSIGVPDADSRASLARPFRGTGVEHDGAVREYFVSAGLPSEQISGVTVHATLLEPVQSVADVAAGRLAKPELQGFSSVVSRESDGVRVQNSYAWARINAEGAVVAEEVYWPPLPGDVVREVGVLKAEMDDAESRQEIISHLPAKWRELPIEVMIFHSTYYQPKFEAFAGLNVQTRDTSLRFSRDGRPLFFARETNR